MGVKKQIENAFAYAFNVYAFANIFGERRNHISMILNVKYNHTRVSAQIQLAAHGVFFCILGFLFQISGEKKGGKETLMTHSCHLPMELGLISYINI